MPSILNFHRSNHILEVMEGSPSDPEHRKNPNYDRELYLHFLKKSAASGIGFVFLLAVIIDSKSVNLPLRKSTIFS